MAPSRSSYRNRNTQRQTRLQFSSLPSSSPNKKEYSSSVQDRLARVTYMGRRESPRKAPRAGNGLLSPEASSQPKASDSSSPLSDPPASSPINKHLHAAESESEAELITPLSKRRKTSGGVTSLSTPLRKSARFQPSSPTPAAAFDSDSPIVVSDRRVPSDLGDAETTDDDAEILASSATKRRRPAPKAKPKAKETYRDAEQLEDDWLVGDDEEVEYISSDSEPVAKRRKRGRRMSRREKEELDADLKDLQDSDTESSGGRRRTRGGPVTTQRDEDQEHFALLRRRRRGEKIPRVYDSEDESGQSADGADINLIGRPTQLSDGGSVHSSIDTESDHEQVEEELPEDFIVEDEEGPADERRPQSDIPLQFTPFATKKPRELFFHVVEWLIKNKIAPAFPRDDEIYHLSFRKVDDEVSAQAGSRLISSAWNAEFKHTILARPDIAISQDVPDPDATCDACNRTNHPARYAFVLSGQPYSTKTLEPVEHDEEVEDDAMGLDVDEKGRTLAPVTKHFYLGTHCSANAQMGHKLTHWKYHLNENILQYLAEQDVLSDRAIVAREKKNKKAREKEAEAIVDSMEETGKIRELWSEFHCDLKDAMLGMVDYEVKNVRTKGRVGVVQARAGGMVREWNLDKYSVRRDMSSDDD